MGFPFGPNDHNKITFQPETWVFVKRSFSEDRKPQLKLSNISSAQTADTTTHDDTIDLEFNSTHIEQYPQEIIIETEEMEGANALHIYQESVESMATGSSFSTLTFGAGNKSSGNRPVASVVDHLAYRRLTADSLDLHTVVHNAMPTYTGDIEAWLNDTTPRYSGPITADHSSVVPNKKSAASYISDVSSCFVYVAADAGPEVLHNFKDIGAWSDPSPGHMDCYSNDLQLD